jgi:dihydrolipoamide dehydrogenase
MVQTDIIVIGAGPGGYVAAIRAAQLGYKVTLIDKRLTAGGTCLNVGCIPSKALLSSSLKVHELEHGLDQHGIKVSNVSFDLEKIIARKNKIVDDLTKGIGFLLKKNQISFINGHAQLLDSKRVQVATDIYEATTAVLLALGSIPTVPGFIKADEEKILTSTGALDMTQVPKTLAVMGGGYIGLELGSVWARLGAKVTVIEALPTIAGAMDKDMSKALLKSLEKQGIDFKLNHKILEVVNEKEGVLLKLEGELKELKVDKLLVCVGRRPATKDQNLEALGIKLDEHNLISVNENYETSLKGVYAIGDCTTGPMLAHKASEEGVVWAERLKGQKSHFNKDVIPAVIYTHPEVASVGKTQQELEAAGVSFKVGTFPFSADSRSRTVGQTEGFVKIVAHSTSDLLLGVHIFHEQAGSLISEAATVMEFGGSSEDLARVCHAHPTFSEALKEAALNTFSKCIHL